MKHTLRIKVSNLHLTHLITYIIPSLHCKKETTLTCFANEMIQIKRCVCLCVIVGGENWTNPEGEHYAIFVNSDILLEHYCFIHSSYNWHNIRFAGQLVVKEWVGWLQNKVSHCIVTQQGEYIVYILKFVINPVKHLMHFLHCIVLWLYSLDIYFRWLKRSFMHLIM